MKVLATADLHIGRVSSMGRSDSSLEIEALQAWHRVVRTAIREEVAAVVIAGDLLDSDAGTVGLWRAVAQGFEQLKEAQIPAIAVTGNHDATALRSFLESYPECGLRILGLPGEWEAEVLPTRQGPLHLVGWSFPKSGECKKLPFDRMPAGTYDLGLVHGDADIESRYAPFLSRELDSRCRVWVAGHVHATRFLNAQRSALYVGSPQALDFGELGDHGAWLVHYDSALPNCEFIPLSTVRYELVQLDASDDDETLIRQLQAKKRNFPEFVRYRVTLRTSSETMPKVDDSIREAADFDWQIVRVIQHVDDAEWERALNEGSVVGYTAQLIACLSGREDLLPMDDRGFVAEAVNSLVAQEIEYVKLVIDKTKKVAAFRETLPTYADCEQLARGNLLEQCESLFASMRLRS